MCRPWRRCPGQNSERTKAVRRARYARSKGRLDAQSFALLTSCLKEGVVPADVKVGGDGLVCIPGREPKDVLQAVEEALEERFGQDYASLLSQVVRADTLEALEAARDAATDYVVRQHQLTDDGVGFSVSEVPLSPLEAEERLFSHLQVHGRINPDRMEPGWEERMGFSTQDHLERMLEDGDRWGTSSEPHVQASRKECSRMSPDERKALTLYANDAFMWCQARIYGEDYVPKPSYLATDQDRDHAAYEIEATDDNLVELVSCIDSALDKTPGRPRVVYRGVDRGVCGDGDPAEWVKENAAVGSVLQWNGFISTSSSLRVAKEYGEEGFVTEIVTSSGVNISSVSFFDYEREVLLPRESRFLVLGHKKVRDKEGGCMLVVQMVEVDESGVAGGSHRRLTPASEAVRAKTERGSR